MLIVYQIVEYPAKTLVLGPQFIEDNMSFSEISSKAKAMGYPIQSRSCGNKEGYQMFFQQEHAGETMRELQFYMEVVR